MAKKRYWADLALSKSALETIDCPLCDHGNYIKITTIDRNHLPLSTVLCSHCGLVYINPRPTQAWYQHFYEHNYRRIYESVNIPSKTYAKTPAKLRKHQHNVNLLLPFLAGKNSILDIGAAEGVFLNTLHAVKPHMRLVGIEPNAQFTEFAREHYALDEMYIGHFPDALNSRQDKFDAIHTSHVFEHILDPNQFLAHCRSYLKDDGILFIDVPNVLAKVTGCRYAHVAHVIHYSEKTLSHLLNKWGFKVVAAHDQLRETNQSTEIPWTLQIIAQKQPTVPESFRLDAITNAHALAGTLQSHWKMPLFRRLRGLPIELRYRCRLFFS